MGARASWRDAQGLSGVVDLSFNEVFVGRAVECAIRTDDPMVSRRHARIYFQDGRHVIEDLGSANGIFVGEQRVQMHPLNNGDSVRCGNLWIQYTNDGMMGAQPGFGGGSPGLGGFSSAPGFGSPPATAFGGPPPATSFGAPPATSFGGGGGMSFGGPPPAAAPSAAPGGMAAGPPPASQDMGPAEMQRMQRRIDQLQSEVRLLRGGGDKAVRMEELEEKLSRADRDRTELENKLAEAENTLKEAGGGGGSVNISGANLMLSRAEEVVNGLNDVLSELRINVLAAEGEVENWVHQLPAASYELVRESLRSSRMQMETAKDLMKQLRAEGR